MRHALFSLCLTAFLIISSYSEARAEKLQEKVERLEQDLAALQSKVYRGDKGVTTSKGNVDTGNVNLSSKMEVRVGELEERIRELTGKIEQVEHLSAQLNERIEKLVADNEFRFKELEHSKNISAPAHTPKEEVNNNQAITVPSKKMELDKPKSLGTIKLAEEEEKTLIAKRNARTARPEYDAAYALLRDAKFDDAEKAFIKFIEKYSEHSLVGNCYFWLGEIYTSKKNYEKAAIHYLRGYKKFPKGDKAPECLLKLAKTLNTLEKKKEACATIAKIKKEYPELSNTLKQRTREEAASLGCK
jgi:tol-pal system protein YbgF